mgnify:FL=1
MDDCNSDHPFAIKEEVKNKSKIYDSKTIN